MVDFCCVVELSLPAPAGCVTVVVLDVAVHGCHAKSPTATATARISAIRIAAIGPPLPLRSKMIGSRCAMRCSLPVDRETKPSLIAEHPGTLVS